MRQGAKSKGFVRQNDLRMASPSRIKVLQCLWKFGLARPLRWQDGPFRNGLIIVRNRRGSAGERLDRGDGAAVTTASLDRLTTVERQLEVSVRSGRQPGHARQVDQT